MPSYYFDVTFWELPRNNQVMKKSIHNNYNPLKLQLFITGSYKLRIFLFMKVVLKYTDTSYNPKEGKL